MMFSGLASVSSDSLAGQVTLAWDPSSDPTVAGYNVYYGGASLTYTNMVYAGAHTSITVSNLSSAGLYYFAATVIDATGLESVYSSEVVYRSAASPCLVALTNLNQVYDGASKPVSVVTTPAGISVTLTYNGSPTLPVAAGNYQVIATVTDTNYYGGATNVLTIAKAAASIQLGNLNQTYDGTGKSVTVTTVPAALGVSVLYGGSSTPPTNAGSYTVVGTLNDINYTGRATNTLTISKAAARVLLSNLTQSYDGKPKTVKVSTTPTGLAVVVTYNGKTQAPTRLGSYTVIATITNLNYAGAATNTLTITKIKPAGILSAPLVEGPLVLSWPSSTNTITILQSTDLVTWSTVTNLSLSSSLTLPSEGDIKFFKAMVWDTNGWTAFPLLLQRP